MQDSMYTRLRYYRQLGGQSRHGSVSEFEPPAHVLPPELLVVSSLSSSTGEKQSSLTTIFSIWNTMIGSTLLTMPWGYAQAGLIGGVGSVFFLGAISYYTCALVVDDGAAVSDDFIETCRYYLGPKGRIASWACSVLIFLGALIAYSILLSDSLFSIVNTIGKWAGAEDVSDDSEYATWDKNTAVLVLMAAIFPLTMLKKLGILLKLNSLGIASVVYMIFFVTGKSGEKMATVDKLATAPIESGVGQFAGILTLSYFSHSFVQTILKNNAEQKNNKRDLAAAYILVGICYGLPGMLAYIAYGEEPDGLEQNFLNNLGDNDIGAFIARLLLLFQLYLVFPTLLYIFRIQFFGVVLGTTDLPFKILAPTNALIVGVCIVFAIFYPNVGDVLRYAGAVCGGTIVFVLPILNRYQALKMEGKTMTPASYFLHACIIGIGVASLASQFTE
eukprot:TRINITY_DN5474_c0_g1_i1.p1 TRINITY_DN5474_c0_g1~~TRINITY_DN5474_c0_g1_i1.p1  ORF type:complete len:498 (+),score=122.02 TRINITY_DN5474_c0_g1_i1:160-1494(+)